MTTTYLQVKCNDLSMVTPSVNLIILHTLCWHCWFLLTYICPSYLKTPPIKEVAQKSSMSEPRCLLVLQIGVRYCILWNISPVKYIQYMSWTIWQQLDILKIWHYAKFFACTWVISILMNLIILDHNCSLCTVWIHCAQFQQVKPVKCSF